MAKLVYEDKMRMVAGDSMSLPWSNIESAWFGNLWYGSTKKEEGNIYNVHEKKNEWK